MKVALVGPLQSGKSTILSSLSGKAIPAIGSASIEEVIVPVPDERFDWMTEQYKPKKTTHATIDCLDLPGFNFTDDHGRAAAKRLISQIKTAELLVLYAVFSGALFDVGAADIGAEPSAGHEFGLKQRDLGLGASELEY